MVDICLPANAHANVLLDHVGTVFADLVPVDDIPKVGDVFRTSVLVLEVVSVFPDIQTQNGEHDFVRDSLHERIVLIGCVDELEFVPLLVNANPYPSGSKGGSWSGEGFEFGLHFVHTSETGIDEVDKLRRGLGVLGLIRRSHFVPEKGVIVVPTATVAVGRTRFDSVLHQIKNGHLVLAFGSLVNVGNVGSVMLVVVDLHCGCVNVRFESFEGVREVGDRVRVSRDRGRSDGKPGSDGRGLFEKTAARTRAVYRSNEQSERQSV